MMMMNYGPRPTLHRSVRVLTRLASLLLTALAIAIISIIAVRLNNVWVTYPTQVPQLHHLEYTCLLGYGTYSANSLCIYGYIASSFSIAIALSLALMMVLPCFTFGIELVWEFVLAFFGLIWWICAAAVFTHYSQSADGAGLPQANWRHAIFAMSWVCVGIYLALCIIYVVGNIKARHAKNVDPNNAAALPHNFTTAEDVLGATAIEMQIPTAGVMKPPPAGGLQPKWVAGDPAAPPPPGDD